MKKRTHQPPTVKKFDWVVIEQEYVTSQEKPSLRDLEKKYG